MKKIKNIKQLRKVLRNIINTQDCDEIKNFNTLYDYSNITDMPYLWKKIIKEEVKEEKIEWKNIKFPILDMINVVNREGIFENSLLYEINLINTHNIKRIDSGFYQSKNLEKISLDLKACEDRESIFYDSSIKEVELLNTQNIINLDYGFTSCENLEKLNSLYLDNCEYMINCFGETNIKKINLYNTGKVKEWNGRFWSTNIEEIELDMSSRKFCKYMFKNRKVKKINLKNCENIKNIEEFICECENLDYLEVNISNMENMSNFINNKNNIKYLKLTGLEGQKLREKEIREKLNKKFFDGSQEINPIPHIELVKNNTSFDIIGDNNSSIRLEKKKEKERKCELKKEKMRKKEGKIKTKKEYNIEINL